MKKVVKGLILGVLIVLVLLRLFCFSFVFTSGSSMYPTIKDGGMLIVSKVAKIDRGDIVAVKSEKLNKILCKRVIAVGEDSIYFKDNNVFVNGNELSEGYINSGKVEYIDTQELLLPKGTVYCLGDNRNHSTDSRTLGVFKDSQVLGKVVFNGSKYHITKEVYKIPFIILFGGFLVWMAHTLRYGKRNRVISREDIDKSQE